MAILKFRVYLEEDESIYRDISIKHTQLFSELHETILIAYEFDKKHKATFFRSNEQWQRGKEITLELYERTYTVPPQLMKETAVGSEIRDSNQRFVYLYDFNKNWIFLLELISVSKEENMKITYPAIVRVEGVGPSQYGVKTLLDSRFAEVEEKYDLNKETDGYGEEGEDADSVDSEFEDDVIVDEEGTQEE